MLKPSYFNSLNGKYHYGMPIKQLLMYFNNTLHKGRALMQITSPHFLSNLAMSSCQLGQWPSRLTKGELIMFHNLFSIHV